MLFISLVLIKIRSSFGQNTGKYYGSYPCTNSGLRYTSHCLRAVISFHKANILFLQVSLFIFHNHFPIHHDESLQALTYES
jgi:hypothetical protein